MQTNHAMADTRDMSRDVWLEERRKGIGGSDAAAIMGVSPYSSQMMVYLDKLGMSEPGEENEASRIGHDLEGYVAQRFMEDTGKKVRKCNKILQHPEHEWMLANIDRDVVGEDAGFEAKTTSVYNKTDFESGIVPPNYFWQCQHYMAVTGASRWYLGVLVLGKAYHTFKIERNDDLIELLIAKEKEFWQEHVLKRVPPLPTGSEADEEAIALIYPKADDEIEIMDLHDMQDSLDLLEALKADRKILDKKISEKEQEIKLAMGTVQCGVTNRWRVSWKNQSSERIDSKLLRTEMPEVAARYVKRTESRVFKITKLKEAI